MQILLVVGVTWAGIAAKQGGTHIWFWLAAILTLFMPLAAVVGWCAQVWPLEGGVYQWTKYALGPFAGFMSAWNFGMWALLAVSNVGIVTATSLSYGLGPRAAWIEDNHTLIAGFTVALFLVILLVNLPGFGIGRWVSHFGTAVTVLVTVLLMGLLFYHPHASAAHPHVNPQSPFSFGMPVLTLMTINLFTKIAFNGSAGLEQVAVFAGETRNPGRAIMRSAWIAAPIIAVIYILMTGSMLAYIPAANVDLTGPIPQILAAAFGGGTATGTDWGLHAWPRHHPGARHRAGSAVRGHRGRNQPPAHGRRLGPHDSRMVHPARSALEDPDPFHRCDCRASNRHGPAGNLRHRRAGGVPGDQFRGQRQLRTLLPDDVRDSARRWRPLWRARRVLAEGCGGQRTGGHAVGYGLPGYPHRGCGQQMACSRPRWRGRPCCST